MSAIAARIGNVQLRTHQLDLHGIDNTFFWRGFKSSSLQGHTRLATREPVRGVGVCGGLKFATLTPTRDYPTRNPYGFVTPVTIPM